MDVGISTIVVFLIVLKVNKNNNCIEILVPLGLLSIYHIYTFIKLLLSLLFI